MTDQYYEKKDLADFQNIGEHAPELANAFFAYYERATSAGELSAREKSLIAIAIASTQNCPYCIDACTSKCLSLGMSETEIMEAIHVGASMMAGVTLAHATQARKIIRKKGM